MLKNALRTYSEDELQNTFYDVFNAPKDMSKEKFIETILQQANKFYK
jgi:disulfide oxidoreductase YuzD